MLISKGWICTCLSHSKVTCDMWNTKLDEIGSIHLSVICWFKWNCKHFIQLEVCECEIPSSPQCLLSKYHLTIYREQSGIYLKQEHTIPREIQKSTFKSIHIWTSKKKIKEIRKQSSPLEFPSVFPLFLTQHLIDLHSNFVPMILKWTAHSLACTLVVEGRVSGFVRWHRMSRHWDFHLQRQPCVFYTFCFFDLWSNTLLNKIQRL